MNSCIVTYKERTTNTILQLSVVRKERSASLEGWNNYRTQNCWKETNLNQKFVLKMQVDVKNLDLHVPVTAYWFLVCSCLCWSVIVQLLMKSTESGSILCPWYFVRTAHLLTPSMLSQNNSIIFERLVG